MEDGMVAPVSLFAWLISHQPAVLFSQNKSVTSNQQYFSLSTNQHQPNEHAEKLVLEMMIHLLSIPLTKK
jgi:hypothetical protein